MSDGLFNSNFSCYTKIIGPFSEKLRPKKKNFSWTEFYETSDKWIGVSNVAEIILDDGQQFKDCLLELAENIVDRIADQDPEHSQEILSSFVAQLFLVATKQTLRRERKARQAEGIARAKAKGVKFGVERRPLPDNFDEVRIAWRNREMNLKEAAKRCGMASTTFYDAVRRAEEQEAS